MYICLPGNTGERLRASRDGAVVDGVYVRQDWYAVPRTKVSGIFEDIIRDLGRHNQKRRVCVAEGIILVDCGDSPALVRQLFANSLSSELRLWIVKIPSIHFLFVLKGPMAECIQFFNGTEPASPRPDEIKGFAGDVIVGKVESNKGEIAAPNAYRRGLPRSGRRWAKSAVREDWKRQPSLSHLWRRCRIDSYTWRGFYRSAKNHMVVGKAQDAGGGLAAINALDIVDDLRRSTTNVKTMLVRRASLSRPHTFLASMFARYNTTCAIPLIKLWRYTPT